MWQIGSGVFMGWSLGTNDAANVFGTAVASRMIPYKTAIIVCSAFVLLGAMLEGGKGVETYSEMSSTTLDTAFIVCLGAAAAMTILTILKLPASTSQAIVGGLVLLGWRQSSLHTGPLVKIVICWVTTPIGSMVISIILFFVLGKILNALDLNLFQYDRWNRWGLITAGAYGSYALGANNVANVTGPFVGEGMFTVPMGCLIGGLSICFGVLSYSRNVMMTVGRNIVKLSAFPALVVVISEAITVHIYTQVGVPVSTSQAVVGAVVGMGLVKGVRTVNKVRLARVLSGWAVTPVLSFGLTWGIYEVMRLLNLT